MNPYDKIAKMFSAYASRIEVDVRSLQFFSVRDKDKAIHADDTPQSLVYDDNENDRIDLLVIVHAIMIHVKDEGGEEIHIKMARTSKMAKAFSAYASRKEVDVRSLQFFSVRDEPIGADDTPESLGCDDNDDDIKLLVRRRSDTDTNSPTNAGHEHDNR
jgi:NAD(P)H-flavin reductase